PKDRSRTAKNRSRTRVPRPAIRCYTPSAGPRRSVPMRHTLRLSVCILFSLPALAQVPTIIKEIGELESVRDPKCYATASRLEDFIYGTPLEPEARFQKIAL